MTNNKEPNFNDLVYEVIRIIPESSVITYGQIAKMIGHPRHARHVGYALAALPEDHKLPWHRVVNSKGEISARAKPGYEEYQRILLEEEGVEFTTLGRISLKKFAWTP